MAPNRMNAGVRRGGTRPLRHRAENSKRRRTSLCLHFVLSPAAVASLPREEQCSRRNSAATCSFTRNGAFRNFQSTDARRTLPQVISPD